MYVWQYIVRSTSKNWIIIAIKIKIEVSNVNPRNYVTSVLVKNFELFNSSVLTFNKLKQVAFLSSQIIIIILIQEIWDKLCR